MFFLLLLFSCLLGKDSTSQVPSVSPIPNLGGVKDEELTKISFQESQELNPELRFPWQLVYLPVKSCHVLLKDEAGAFSSPPLSGTETNNWCNWTIWAGPRKHILIYIEGFEGKSDCEGNQDRIVFQGVLSSLESKVAYACGTHGTLTFATRAAAVQVVFLSEASSQDHSHKHFKGQYYIFEDYVNSTGGEEPVLKSNSTAGFSPKSYVLHSRHRLNLVNTSQMLSKENWLPTANKRTTKIGLEAFLNPTVSSPAHVSPLNSTKNSLNPPDLKRMQVVKLSTDSSRSGNKIPTSVLENYFTYKSDVLSTASHETQNFKTIEQNWTELETTKDNGIATASVSLPNGGHTATDWMPKHTGSVGSVGRDIKAAIAFPLVSSEEQQTPILPPKSVPVTMKEEMLQTSHSTFKDVTKTLMESPQQTKVYKREQTDNQAYGIENGSSAAKIIESGGIIESLSKSTAKTEFPQTTSSAYVHVLHAPPLQAFSNSWMSTTTSVNPQVTSSNSPNRTQIDILHSKSVTKYREHPRRKRTKPNLPYSPSDWLPNNSTHLKVKNEFYEREPIFRSHENYSALDSQHNPGDLLFEIVLGIEHKGQFPPVGSNLEKIFIDSIKYQVREKMKLFSNKIKAIKLKEIMRKEKTEKDRQNGSNLVFMFWLHLTPEEENASHLLHFHLEDLRGLVMGTGKIQTVLVRDVNECSSGIGLCDDGAICLNGYGTYFCQCKEEYEDRSMTESGTLCVRSPRSGLSSLYSFTEILVGITVFFISVLVVVISVLCTIIKKRRTKKDINFHEAALPRTPAAPRLPSTTFDQNNIQHLLTLDPAQLKLRAKRPEWPLQSRTSPRETYRISIEQSSCL